MSIVKMNDIEIYYELHGAGESLILVSGYTCDHNFWQYMIESLAKKYRVLIFDNRAVGQTKDAGLPFTLEKMADDTMRLIEELKLVNSYILGQSMGGAIVQHIARKYSNKIKKAIILNSAGKFNLRTMLAIEGLLNLRKEDVSFDNLFAASIPWFYSSDFLSSMDNIQKLKMDLLNNPYPQSLEDQERQFHALQQFDARQWLHEIKVPVHVIGAEDDIVALPIESKEIADAIPDAQLTIISGGHSSPTERASKLCDVIYSQFI